MIISLKNINVIFENKSSALKSERFNHALRDINLDVKEGEILTIVGESGCGKTTLGKVITGLLKPTLGKLYYEDFNVYSCMPWDYKKYRANVQFIQQDSYAALNPTRTIYQSLYAPLKRLGKHKNINNVINELMQMVELTPADQFLSKYPHQLSGGQRQRILLARALSMNPKLIVADEPISMIDVSLRFSMLNLFTKLNTELGITIVYITHDLATARCVAANGRLFVMYYGECVEEGRTEELLNDPKHPYTQALLSAVPIPDPNIEKEKPAPQIKECEDLFNKNGCGFANRCIYADQDCYDNKIEYEYIGDRKILCRKIKDIPSWGIKK
ncbi:MAG: ABC transporter ATP-binding protein [Acholeplasmataceae bacterium]